jgi:phosphoribosylglycinamide formyltransferase-1
VSARLGVLVSGGGRSLENLAEVIARGELDVELALVVSSSAQAFALERAARLGIASVTLLPRDHDGPEAYSRAVFAELERARCDLAVLAGFLRLLVVPDAWLGRVLNIHPALLPDFGGKGFYGERVHAAVLESGRGESGCTVHYVTNAYDAGPVILQRRVPVEPGHDVHALAARVFEAEKLALPEALRMHLNGSTRFRTG